MVLVKDLMNKKVFMVSPDETISKVISLMVQKSIYEVPVVDLKKRLLGMVTLYDILNLIKYPEKLKARSLMTMPPVISPEDDEVDIIRMIINTGNEAFPVVEDEKVVGIISDYDIIKYYINKSSFRPYKTADLMETDFPVLNEYDSVGKTRRVMDINRADRLPVVKDGKYAGVVLLNDLMERFYFNPSKMGKKDFSGELLRLVDRQILDLVRIHKRKISPDTNLRDALDYLISKNIKSVEVINADNEVVGLLLRRNALRFLQREISQKGVIVNFTGYQIPWAESFLIDKRLRDWIPKIVRYSPKTQEINFNVKLLHGGKGVKKFEVKAGLIRIGNNEYVKLADYNLTLTIDNILEKLFNIVKKQTVTSKGYPFVKE